MTSGHVVRKAIFPAAGMGIGLYVHWYFGVARGEGLMRHRGLSRQAAQQEAIAMLRRAAAVEQATMERPGDRLRALVGDAYFTNEEIEAIAASRHEPDRALPSFG